jgi:flagellar motor protein MotB
MAQRLASEVSRHPSLDPAKSLVGNRDWRRNRDTEAVRAANRRIEFQFTTDKPYWSRF